MASYYPQDAREEQWLDIHESERANMIGSWMSWSSHVYNSPLMDVLLCPLCGSALSIMRCDECRFVYVTGEDGAVRLHERDWSMAFDDRPSWMRMHLRDPLTIRVRELLYQYHNGRSLPDDCLRFLVALLIDMHTHVEGQAIRHRPPPPPVRPQPRRLPNLRMGMGGTAK